MKIDPRIFRASELDANAKGWIVDLSEGDMANPDCYWRIRTLRSADRFLRLIDTGIDPEHAHRQATA